MSLLYSYKRAKVDEVLDKESISDYITKSNYAVTDIEKQYDHIKIRIYSLDFYGMSFYHRAWDYWRLNNVQYSFHHKDKGGSRFHFPFYYQRRNSVFQYVRVVDK